MPIVTGTEKDPSGAAHRNALVRVRLVAALVGAAPGYVAASDYSIIGSWQTRTDSAGAWSVTLVANELISPADTYYQADVTPKVGATIRHEFAVPNGAGPYRVEDILTDPPATLPTLHINDASDAHDASAISFAPAGTVAATDVQGAIVEVAADAAASDAALDVRVDALEAGGGYDPNAVAVLRFNGESSCQINCGDFWPIGVDLGHFFWDAWVAPTGNGYLISDGAGGSHALLWGFLVSSGRASVTGNVYSGLALTTFSADDVVEVGQWAHHAVGWDGTNIYCWVNGILSGLTPYASARRAGLGQLYVMGSDHQNLPGDLGQLRGFEDCFLPATPRIGFVPETYFGSSGRSGTIDTASFLQTYMTPGQLTVADISDGYNGVLHPGTLGAGNGGVPGRQSISTGAIGGISQAPGRPLWVVSDTAPFHPDMDRWPTGPVDAIPSLPAGVDTYDSFNRAEQHRLMIYPTLGVTDARASLGAQTWTTSIVNDARESLWGIINGRAVCLYAQGEAFEVAWVPRTAAGAGMDVRVDRRGVAASTFDTGLCLRVADNANHYGVVTRNDSSATTATVNVWLLLAGAFTNLTPTPLTCPATAWTTLRAVMPTGSTTMTIYVDDLAGGWTQIGQLTGLTNHSTAKGAGLANYHLSTLARHDNFRVLAA